MVTWKSFTGALGRGYDYATPGTGSSRLTDSSGWGDRPAATPAPRTPFIVNTGQRNAAPVSGATDNSAYINSMNARLADLQRQLAYQPKLPTFDIMGNYNRARSQAESAVNPLYDKYLKDFLARQESGRVAKRGEIQLTKEATAQELQRVLAGSSVDRTRTAEDVASAIGRIGEQETQFQQETGTQFDTDRRQLAEQTAASGLTTSGIGQGIIFDQNNKRNMDEATQVKEYGNQRQAKKLFEARTFEDLARGDRDAREIAAGKDKGADFDLETYLTELSHDETQFRGENEYKRISDIAGQTGTFQQQGSQQFLSSLTGAGWRPQDIALAYQVYG